MKKALFLLLLVLAGCGKPMHCDHWIHTTGEPVVCVIDGDTVKLADDTRVRFVGMDTPEINQKGHDEATSALINLTNNTRIRFEKDISDKDQFGRLLRFVYANDVFVNLAQVKLGWARAKDFPPDTSRSALFHAAEAQAHIDHVGLWQ